MMHMHTEVGYVESNPLSEEDFVYASKPIPAVTQIPDRSFFSIAVRLTEEQLTSREYQIE